MTGADFKYLLATAQVESNLNPNAQASTSSARGLFQFIEQTWLTTLKEQGAALGYGPYASAISRQPSGDYARVRSERWPAPIMSLRSDPTANALMAGAFTKVNAGKLADRLGRDPTEGELYIAHFLGADRRKPADRSRRHRPNIRAAAVFPGAARANPTIFYDGRGNARSAARSIACWSAATTWRAADPTTPRTTATAANGGRESPGDETRSRPTRRA